MEAAGSFCSDLVTVNFRISSERIVQLYYEVKAKIKSEIQSVLLPVPKERIGWSFLFALNGSFSVLRFKVNDGGDWKNNKGGDVYKCSETGITFKRMYYYSKENPEVRRLIVNFFELKQILVLYYQSGNFLARLGESQKKSYDKHKRKNADEIKVKSNSTDLSENSAFNLPWKSNVPVRFLLFNSQSIEAYFKMASQSSQSFIATFEKQVKLKPGDLYLYSKKEVFQNQQTFNKLLRSDAGSVWKNWKTIWHDATQGRIKVKYYCHKKSEETRKMIVENESFDFVMVYYFYVCCEKKFAWFDFIIHQNSDHFVSFEGQNKESLFKQYLVTNLANFASPVATTFSEYKELLKNPNKMFERVTFESRVGIVYPYPGRTYLTVKNHVDGYTWNVKCSNEEETVLEALGFSYDKLPLEAASFLFKSVKKMGKVSLEIPDILHSVTYFIICPQCETLTFQFESTDDLACHIELCHSSIFSL